MEVKQVYEFVNSAAQESIGESAILAEDLSNVVDMGTAIFNGEAFDKFVDQLNELVAKVNVKVTITSSIPVEEASETVKKYL